MQNNEIGKIFLLANEKFAKGQTFKQKKNYQSRCLIRIFLSFEVGKHDFISKPKEFNTVQFEMFSTFLIQEQSKFSSTRPKHKHVSVYTWLYLCLMFGSFFHPFKFANGFVLNSPKHNYKYMLFLINTVIIIQNKINLPMQS